MGAGVAPMRSPCYVIFFFEHQLSCEFDEFRVDTRLCKLRTIIPIPVFFCQLRTNTTASAAETGTTATIIARLPHRLYFSKESPQGKESPADAIPRRMHAPLVFPWIRSTPTTFAWRSLTTRTIFPLVFYFQYIFPVFIHPPHAISQTKSVCVI